MKKRFIYLAASALLISAITVVSCKKDKETTTTSTKALSEILVGGKWYTTAQTITTKITVLGKTESDVTSLEDCDKDDYMIFSADNSYTEGFGTVKCDGDIDEAENGKWVISADGKTLSMTATSGDMKDVKLNYIVTKNSDTSLKLEINQTYSMSFDGVSASVEAKGSIVVEKK